MSEAKLGRLLARRKDSVQISDFETYKRVTIRMNGKGVHLRDAVEGCEIGTKSQFRIKSGQFLLSKIDARNGAFGVVPEVCDGAVITGNFWTFDINDAEIDLTYLDYFSRTTAFVDLCLRASDGTTNRRYLDERKFAALTIPLPSLDEQRRVVSKVQEAMGALDRAAALHDRTVADFDRLLIALAHRDDLTEDQKRERGWRKLRLGDVMHLDLDPVRVDPAAQFPTAGCYSFARGLFAKPPITGLDIQASTLYRLRGGQFTYLKLKAFEGAYGLVLPEFDGCCVSNEYPTFTPLEGSCRGEFVFAYFKDEKVWRSLAEGSKGIGARRERVKPSTILAYEVWLPPLTEQERIAQVLAAQRRHQANDTFARDADALRRAILAKAFRGEM